MKYFFDNNLSPYLARALSALCEPGNVEVFHLRDKFAANVSDIEWIETLGAEGQWTVISQDRLMRNPGEKEALRRSGLIAFVLGKGWSDQREWDKAWRLIRWWERIMEQAELIQGGAVFEVPVRFSGKGRFRQVRL